MQTTTKKSCCSFHFCSSAITLLLFWALFLPGAGELRCNEISVCILAPSSWKELRKDLCEFMLCAMDLDWEGDIGYTGVRKFSSWVSGDKDRGVVTLLGLVHAVNVWCCCLCTCLTAPGVCCCHCVVEYWSCVCCHVLRKTCGMDPRAVPRLLAAGLSSGLPLCTPASVCVFFPSIAVLAGSL